MVLDSHVWGIISKSTPTTSTGFVTRYLKIASKGNTIVRKTASNDPPNSYKPAADIRRWDRDANKRFARYYHLYVLSGSVDTITNFSQRFAYEESGRLKMAWFDHMYLGKLYMPVGPDTIWYRYDSRNRLAEEEYRYTTDMANKSEFDDSKLSKSEKQINDIYKKRFFEGGEYSVSNNQTDVIKYQYVNFDRVKHHVLQIPDPN